MNLSHIVPLALGLALLAGCKSNTAPVKADPHAVAPTKVALGPVKMPAGVDYARARLIAENRRTKLYTELVGIGDPSNEKLLFPARVAQDIGVTPVQMRRRFMDTVSRGRRFEIYAEEATSSTPLECPRLHTRGTHERSHRGRAVVRQAGDPRLGSDRVFSLPSPPRPRPSLYIFAVRLARKPRIARATSARVRPSAPPCGS